MMLKKFFLLLFIVFSFSGTQASASGTRVEKDARIVLARFLKDIKRAKGKGVIESLRSFQKRGDFSAERFIYAFLVSAFGEEAVMGLWRKRPVQEGDIVLNGEEFISVLVSGGYLNALSEYEVEQGILNHCVRRPDHALIFLLASGVMLGDEPSYYRFLHWDMESKHDLRTLYAPKYSAIEGELFGMVKHNWHEFFAKSYESLSKSYEKKRKKVEDDRAKILFVLDVFESISPDDQAGSVGGQRRRSHSLSLVGPGGVPLAEDEL